MGKGIYALVAIIRTEGQVNRMSDDLISRKAVIEENVDKVRVSSAEIVVHGTKENPYYEIEYFDLSDNEIHIGFSSYKLDFVFEYLEKYFDIVNEENKSDQVQDYHSDDLISRKAVIYILENMIFEVGKDLSKSYLLQDARERIIRLNAAFDKEKVIEELKGEIELCVTHPLYPGKYIKKNRAIEIVEKGGIE